MRGYLFGRLLGKQFTVGHRTVIAGVAGPDVLWDILNQGGWRMLRLWTQHPDTRSYDVKGDEWAFRQAWIDLRGYEGDLHLLVQRGTPGEAGFDVAEFDLLYIQLPNGGSIL